MCNDFQSYLHFGSPSTSDYDFGGCSSPSSRQRFHNRFSVSTGMSGYNGKFQCHALNGGLHASYQWKVNNINREQIPQFIVIFR